MDTPNDEEQRINWRWQWLSAIQAFADIELQRRRWTDPHERNPHYSFVECMCSYFDDAFMTKRTHMIAVYRPAASPLKKPE